MVVLKSPTHRRPRMASISYALERIKGNPLDIVDPQMIEQACRENDHQWRKRELDPPTTIALFLQQVLHHNAPCSEVRHIAGGSFTPQAYCEARARLPLAVYQTLVHEVYQRIAPQMSADQH